MIPDIRRNLPSPERQVKRGEGRKNGAGEAGHQLSVIGYRSREPQLAVMDETDSGLDIDALKIVTAGINKIKSQTPGMTVLLITHYQRMLNYITPDRVHVMAEGRIIRSGGAELALELEERGYDWVRGETAGVGG
jgi:Fe-S cluster assembly ATP-binding protein